MPNQPQVDKIDAKAIVADHRRRNAIKAERDAVNAAIDAAAARQLRELVPDLRPQVEAQIVAAEQREVETRERAAGLRSRAELGDADYPDLTKDLGDRIAGLEEQYVRFSEMADAPELYKGDDSAAGNPDPATFFRFQAANALASLEATRAAIASQRDGRKPTGRTSTPPTPPETS